MMETSSSNSLRNPVKKKTNAFKHQYPFPIIRSECDFDGQSDTKWKCVEGYLQDNFVLIRDEESIKLLYNRGFFGKGTLSKNAPKVCFEKEEEEIEEENKQDSQNEIDVIEIDDEDEAPPAKTLKVEDVEVVLSDSNSADSISEVSSTKKDEAANQESSEEKENLQLTFEEAYFLSYGLGCLVVKDEKDQFIDLARLWNKFCEATPEGNFPVMYTAYHHFRSKGWIVKPGVKYGADYLLYKDGPSFYHATYSVIVKPVKEKNFREVRNNRSMTWSSLFALNRLNNSTGKGLLFLYVIKPSSISENKISTPFCISHYTLEEVLFQRWVPTENREESSNS